MARGSDIPLILLRGSGSSAKCFHYQLNCKCNFDTAAKKTYTPFRTILAWQNAIKLTCSTLEFQKIFQGRMGARATHFLWKGETGEGKREQSWREGK